MSKNVAIAAVVIVVLVIAGWYFTRSNQTTNPEVTQVSQTPSSTESASPSASSESTMNENVVTITSSGYSPESITVKAGESITWENTDTENHTVNSDNHPTHLLYPFLNLGLIKPGEKKSLTVSKTGTYTYHDHLNPSNKGTITVE